METAVAIVAAISGVSGLIFPSTVSPAISEALTQPWREVYLALLVLGGLTALIGTVRHGVQGLLIERWGLTVLAIGFTVLVTCVVLTRGWPGTVSALIPAVFIGCTVGRIVQIGHDLGMLKAYDADLVARQIRIDDDRR